MPFEPGKATVYDTTEAIAQFGRAMKKTSRPVALVPLGTGLHAGHIALIRAARSLLGATVVVAWAGSQVPEEFAAEGVDAVWSYRPEHIWPKGERTRVMPRRAELEDPDRLSYVLTGQLAMINVVQPTWVIVGEKDYEMLVNLRHAVTDLHLPVDVRGVPTVRMADGLAVSLRNVDVAQDAHDAALALSAALVAGAHAAEFGEEKVLATARGVLDAAGIEPEYLELRGINLGPAPEQGDARLFVAATVGGVRLTDNVGLPIGIGFKNIQPDQG